jgi:hypothetical protein
MPIATENFFARLPGNSTQNFMAPRSAATLKLYATGIFQHYA